MKPINGIQKGTAGVYKLSINNHIYIGQSIDIQTRAKRHLAELQKGVHYNPFLQHVYNKHQNPKVDLRVLYTAKKELFTQEQLRHVLTITEQIYINYYKADINLQPAYPSSIGYKYKRRVTRFKGELYHARLGVVRINNLSKYCERNNLDIEELKKVLTGKVDQYKGYFFNEKIFKIYTNNIETKEGFDSNEIPLTLEYKDSIDKFIASVLNRNEVEPWSYEELINELLINLVYKQYPNLKEKIKEGKDILNSLSVHKGRTIKECNHTTKFKDVSYIELQNPFEECYKKVEYPIGIPTVLKPTDDNTNTLGWFLKRYRKQLVEGFYIIYVSGSLPDYQQDLIFSEYGKGETNKYILTAKQIENGIITSDILEVIEKLSSHREHYQWMHLKVEQAVYYPKSSEVLPGEMIDNTKWCRIHLYSLLKEVTADLNEHTKQQLLKGMGRAIGSNSFDLGNSIVTNNINACIRMSTWLLAKALDCKFTDIKGGIYTPDKVPYLRLKEEDTFRKPCITSHFIKTHIYKRAIRYKGLIDEPLENFIKRENAQELLDKKALEHLTEYFKPYNLGFKFHLEHKINETGKLAVLDSHSEANYLIYKYDNTEIIKVKQVNPKDYNIHPLIQKLRGIAQDKKLTIAGAEITTILTVAESLANPDKYMDLTPGDEIKIDYVYKPIKGGAIIFEDYKEYNKNLRAFYMRSLRYDRKYQNVPLQEKPDFLAK